MQLIAIAPHDVREGESHHTPDGQKIWTALDNPVADQQLGGCSILVQYADGGVSARHWGPGADVEPTIRVDARHLGSYSCTS